MARCGFRRGYETDAVCDFCEIAKYAAFEHPDDAELQKTAKRIKLTALMLLAAEQNDLNTGANILDDRKADCRECEKQLEDGCLVPYCKSKNGGECIYKTIKYKRQFIEQRLGKGIIEYIARYYGIDKGGNA